MKLYQDVITLEEEKLLFNPDGTRTDEWMKRLGAQDQIKEDVLNLLEQESWATGK